MAGTGNIMQKQKETVESLKRELLALQKLIDRGTKQQILEKIDDLTKKYAKTADPEVIGNLKALRSKVTSGEKRVNLIKFFRTEFKTYVQKETFLPTRVTAEEQKRAERSRDFFLMALDPYNTQLYNNFSKQYDVLAKDVSSEGMAALSSFKEDIYKRVKYLKAASDEKDEGKRKDFYAQAFKGINRATAALLEDKFRSNPDYAVVLANFNKEDKGVEGKIQVFDVKGWMDKVAGVQGALDSYIKFSAQKGFSTENADIKAIEKTLKDNRAMANVLIREKLGWNTKTGTAYLRKLGIRAEGNDELDLLMSSYANISKNKDFNKLKNDFSTKYYDFYSNTFLSMDLIGQFAFLVYSAPAIEKMNYMVRRKDDGTEETLKDADARNALLNIAETIITSTDVAGHAAFFSQDFPRILQYFGTNATAVNDIVAAITLVAHEIKTTNHYQLHSSEVLHFYMDKQVPRAMDEASNAIVQMLKESMQAHASQASPFSEYQGSDRYKILNGLDATIDLIKARAQANKVSVDDVLLPQDFSLSKLRSSPFFVPDDLDTDPVSAGKTFEALVNFFSLDSVRIIPRREYKPLIPPPISYTDLLRRLTKVDRSRILLPTSFSIFEGTGEALYTSTTKKTGTAHTESTSGLGTVTTKWYGATSLVQNEATVQSEGYSLKNTAQDITYGSWLSADKAILNYQKNSTGYAVKAELDAYIRKNANKDADVVLFYEKDSSGDYLMKAYVRDGEVWYRGMAWTVDNGTFSRVFGTYLSKSAEVGAVLENSELSGGVMALDIGQMLKIGKTGTGVVALSDNKMKDAAAGLSFLFGPQSKGQYGDSILFIKAFHQERKTDSAAAEFRKGTFEKGGKGMWATVAADEKFAQYAVMYQQRHKDIIADVGWLNTVSELTTGSNVSKNVGAGTLGLNYDKETLKSFLVASYLENLTGENAATGAVEWTTGKGKNAKTQRVQISYFEAKEGSESSNLESINSSLRSYRSQLDTAVKSGDLEMRANLEKTIAELENKRSTLMLLIDQQKFATAAYYYRMAGREYGAEMLFGNMGALLNSYVVIDEKFAAAFNIGAGEKVKTTGGKMVIPMANYVAAVTGGAMFGPDDKGANVYAGFISDVRKNNGWGLIGGAGLKDLIIKSEGSSDQLKMKRNELGLAPFIWWGGTLGGPRKEVYLILTRKTGTNEYSLSGISNKEDFEKMEIEAGTVVVRYKPGVGTEEISAGIAGLSGKSKYQSGEQIKDVGVAFVGGYGITKPYGDKYSGKAIIGVLNSKESGGTVGTADYSKLTVGLRLNISMVL